MNPKIARLRRAKAHGHLHEEEHHEHSHDQSGGQAVNVGRMERQASLLGGGLLAAYGLTRGSLTGLALAAIGGALFYRGYSGHCHMYATLGHSSAEADQDRSGGKHQQDDDATHRVEQAVATMTR
jgi:hypothetical protein